MKINIMIIKSEILKLNTLIDEYENNYLNLYNEIKKASSYWQDGNSINFFNDADYYKLKIQLNVEEIKQLKEVYNYLINKYSQIGNKITFNLNSRTYLINSFNSYINQIDEIIKLYNNLDLSFCSYERQKLINQRNQFKSIKNSLIKIKKNIINKLEYIEEIEKEINLKLSKISIELLKENNVSNYI
ncbi:MAG: hypothetical protein E7166_01110 [Firmicutes bacterium]|nr:hypothetical protein [Bacillota bacterium]